MPKDWEPVSPELAAIAREFASMQQLALAGETDKVNAAEACREIADRLPDLLRRVLQAAQKQTAPSARSNEWPKRRA